MHPIEKITQAVKEYESSYNTLDSKKIQGIRDIISSNLVLLYPDYDDLATAVDMAELERKVFQDEVTVNYQNQVDTDTNKHYTASKANSLANIESKPYREAEIKANSRLRKMKHIIMNSNQVLNAIASRISNLENR